MKSHTRLLFGLALVALVGCTDSTSPGADLPQFASFEVRALDDGPVAASYGVRTLDVHPGVSGSGQWYISPAPNLWSEGPDPSVFGLRASTYLSGAEPSWSSLLISVAPGHDYPFQGGHFGVRRLSESYTHLPDRLGDNIGTADGLWIEGGGGLSNFHRVYRFEDGDVIIQKIDDHTIHGQAQVIAHAVDEDWGLEFSYEGHPRIIQITAEFRLQTPKGRIRSLAGPGS